MSSDASVAQSLRGTFRILGICWTVHGVIRLIMTICLVVFNGTATVMFGALLVRVPDPYALMRVSVSSIQRRWFYRLSAAFSGS